jgi:hypothetical protein
MQLDTDTEATRHASHMVTFGPRPEPKIEDDAQTKAQDFLGEAPEFVFDLLAGRLVPGSGAEGPEPFILRKAHGAPVRCEPACECGLTRPGQPAGQNQSCLAHGVSPAVLEARWGRSSQRLDGAGRRFMGTSDGL